MFHSGKWKGHWEQKGFGRQAMRPLLLTFTAGEIAGEGQDLLGEFIFIGTYDPHGIIRMVKHYVGKHAVFYTGAYDGEGTISGEWMVAPGVVGPFALQPDLPASSIADLPIRDL